MMVLMLLRALIIMAALVLALMLGPNFTSHWDPLLTSFWYLAAGIHQTPRETVGES